MEAERIKKEKEELAIKLKAEKEAQQRAMELGHDDSRPQLTANTGSMAILGNIGKDSEAKFVPYTAGGEINVGQSQEAAEETKSEAPQVRPQTE